MDPAEEISLISSEGEDFSFSKNKLIEHSDFFKALFNSGMKECHEDHINLPTLSSIGLKAVQDFVQMKKLPTTIEHLSEVLTVCTYLQMSHLTESCISALKDLLTCDNCFRIHSLAEEYMLRDLQQCTVNFMVSNFDRICENDEFYSVQLDILIELLTSDLHVVSEMVVFKAAVGWLSNNKCSDDEETINAVFECIRFALMTENELRECLQTLSPFNLKEHCKVYSEIATARECSRYPQIILEKDLGIKAMPRRMMSCALTFGGFTKSNNSTNRLMITSEEELCDLDKTELTWRCHHPSKDCPRLPRALCEHSVAVVGVFIYIAGGQTKYCQDGRHTSQEVYCLDTRYFKWIKVAAMESPRSLFYMGVIGLHLYAVGGWVRPDTVSRSVERYDIMQDKWEQMSRLEIGLHEHAGAAHKGQLYISGGFKGPYRGHLNRVWHYDPALDLWSELAPMSHSRSYHCMVSTGEQILIAGGVNFTGNDLFEDVMPCEMYNPENDQWTVISQIPRCASCMSYCIVNDCVYIFGGHSFEDDTDHRFIQILDLSTMKWTEKLMMNSVNINFFSCVVTQLPKSITQRFSV